MSSREPRRAVAEVVFAGWGTLEVAVEGVGRTIARGYSGLLETLEPLRDRVRAVYEIDSVEIALAEGGGPIGRYGRQRLVDAARFGPDRRAGLQDVSFNPATRDEEMVVTASPHGEWVGLYVLRDHEGEVASQVLHLAPDQLRWLADVLRRHPGLAPPVAPDPKGDPDWWLAGEELRDSVQARIVAKLARLWEAERELRLGQLVVNLLSRARPEAEAVSELYYAEDTDLDAALDAAINGLR